MPNICSNYDILGYTHCSDNILYISVQLLPTSSSSNPVIVVPVTTAAATPPSKPEPASQLTSTPTLVTKVKNSLKSTSAYALPLNTDAAAVNNRSLASITVKNGDKTITLPVVLTPTTSSGSNLSTSNMKLTTMNLKDFNVIRKASDSMKPGTGTSVITKLPNSGTLSTGQSILKAKPVNVAVVRNNQPAESSCAAPNSTAGKAGATIATTTTTTATVNEKPIRIKPAKQSKPLESSASISVMDSNGTGGTSGTDDTIAKDKKEPLLMDVNESSDKPLCSTSKGTDVADNDAMDCTEAPGDTKVS